MNQSLVSPRRRGVAALAVASAALFVAAMAGCSGTPAATTAPATSAAAPSESAAAAPSGAATTAAKYTFYMVPGMTTHPAYITANCGAQAAAKALGDTEVVFTGSNAWDPAQQIPVVQALLAKTPSALILTPADGAALQPVVQQYITAKIPVIALDTTLNDPTGLAAQITSSNEQGGAAAADALGKAINGTGTVAIISGTPGATTDEARLKGFHDQMAKAYPNVKLLSPQYSKSVTATAQSQVQALMLANGDMKGVFGVNGNSATGAANAVVTGGKKGQIVVAGYDAEPATVEQLKQGNISILVVQDFAQEGKLAVEAAHKAVTGQTVDATPVQLPNIIATTETANDPNISKYYYVTQCS